MDDKTVEAVASATGEVAKTSGKALDLAGMLGGFIGDIVAEPLREVSGMWTDKLRTQRAENYLDLQVRLRKKLDALGPAARLRQVPLRIGVPLLEVATLEEEPDLRDRWATMLANFANEESGVEAHKSFVNVLSELTPLEVKILDVVYSLGRAHGNVAGTIRPFGTGIKTHGLPEVSEFVPEGFSGTHQWPSPPVQLALSNLCRMGVLLAPAAWGGGEYLASVNRTVFGERLFRACTLR